MNKIISPFLSLFLVFSFFVSPVPQTVSAQTATQTQASADLENRLAKIEEKIEARRKELGIPGMSLAIVKDGNVILSKGYGYKSFEKKVPVTADSQFAIGSASKAFTALSVLMSADEGKLSLEENPRKYLSYFKINDAETNEKIKVRNLLTHSSGLNRTDLGWITGKLTREEIIKVAGEAKPVAKLGEKFLYQNVMFAAAGEIVSEVQNMTWENYVAQKIFKPLGMLNSNLSVPEMQKAKDYSLGYEY
ncbi:MAG: serine hydrolase domain-containing protein, partial [Pyrinomonadaceae bacterium]